MAAEEENRTNSGTSPASSCRLSAASAFGFRTAASFSGVSESMTPSSTTPAVWITPPSLSPASRPARASRSETSQAAVRTPSRPARPERLTSSRSVWPRASRCPARTVASAPEPPVIRMVASLSTGAGTVRTTLPMCLACETNRNASGARRTSQLLTGSGVSVPASNRASRSASSSPDAVGPGLGQVEGAVAVAVPDVGLAHLQEPAALVQQAEGGVHELARQGVQHHVDLGEGVGEVERAGAGDPGQAVQHVLLGFGGGAVDLRAQMTGDLHGGHADPAGGGVDQHLLAALEVPRGR